MANPRTGMYDPLNPLGLHSENMYRNPIYSMGAETESFEALGTFIKGGGKLFGKGAGKGAGRLSGRLSGKLSGKLFKRGGSNVDNLVSKLGKGGAKNKNVTKLVDDVATEGGKDAVAGTFRKIPITTGAAIGVGVGGIVIATFVGLGMSDAIVAFTDSYTGANCDDKAADRGLTEGSDEYEQAVKECQQTAMNKLQFLSFGLIAGVGLVGFLIVRKVLPKGSKEEPKEESKEE